MGPDVSKTFWKFGGLVARRNRSGVKNSDRLPAVSLLPVISRSN
jgi:hypothetical protein